jgi:hypothetical protein
MGVKQKALQTLKRLTLPVSYRLSDENGLIDARNVFDSKGVMETRYGTKLYNTTSLGGTVLSMSFYKTNNGAIYKLAKVGTTLYSVAGSGAHTAIKTGLSPVTKHRGVTTGNRHIMAIEGDGLFSFNGTTCTPLGQLPPTTLTAAISAGGSLTANTYQVGITFYSSTTGFESNQFNSAQCVAAAGNLQISISAIPTTAANAAIDTVRIYLKNVTTAGAYLFSGSVALGVSTYTITANSISTITPPVINDAPLSGGGKYVAVFGKKLAYAGNSTYLSDVYLSNNYLPDAFDSTSSQIVLKAEGQGPITGLAVGFYSTSFLSPYLVIFKKNAITIYSELYANPNQVQLDTSVGCVSAETIRVRNGNVYFMSENGWYMIDNGVIQKTDQGLPLSLGGGAIDDVFSRRGWSLQLQSSLYSSCFSVFYSTLNHYMTFVADGVNSTFLKAYVYEERIAGFRVFSFKTAFTCATEGEDDSGNQCIFMADTAGSIYTYSVINPRHDENSAAVSQSIPAYAILPYFSPEDCSSTYNFRTLIVRAIGGGSTINIHATPYFH